MKTRSQNSRNNKIRPEEAKSIYGAYLTLAGASAAIISLVSGLGESIGHSSDLLPDFLQIKKELLDDDFYWVSVQYVGDPCTCACPKRKVFERFRHIFNSLRVILVHRQLDHEGALRYRTGRDDDIFCMRTDPFDPFVLCFM